MEEHLLVSPASPVGGLKSARAIYDLNALE
jgi:hypothetical protein